MGRDRRALSLEAARAALRVRRRYGRSFGQAVDAVDLAETAGLEVLFIPIGSMEGMYYAADPPTILLPSDRPTGRQAFSCAHELGHHVLGHGSRLDTLMLEDSDDRIQDEEWLANMFAAFLLMPITAVARGFRERGWEPGTATPIQIQYRL